MQQKQSYREKIIALKTRIRRTKTNDLRFYQKQLEKEQIKFKVGRRKGRRIREEINEIKK